MGSSPAQLASSVAGDRAGEPLRTEYRAADLGDIAYLLYLVLPHRALMEVGRVRGWIDYLLRPHARRAVRGNLRDLFPEAPRSRIETLTRRFFEYHHMRALLLLLGPLMAVRGDLERILPVDGLAKLGEVVGELCQYLEHGVLVR